MPTNTYTYPFSGGSTGIAGYGDRWLISFGGTWAHDEKWGLIFVSTAGDYDIGSINFFSASLLLRQCATFNDRVYIGAGPQFNFSDNGDPTAWEQQSPGAGEVQYLSYFGGQDAIWALSQLQGRLVVIARRSIQIWTVDADPANFALVQELDNIGTKAPLAVQNLGDFDVVILDDTGFRSLRTREVTLNAYPDDIGTPIDSLVQSDIQAVGVTGACGVVDPLTKTYMCYLNGKIYVYSRWPSSKISAWTTFLPTYEAYTTVTVGANYVASVLTATVVLNSIYKWTPGAHEVSIVNGTQTLTAAGYFKAQGTTVTINGTGATVTYTGLLQLVTVTTFTPQKFVVYNGIVYCRAGNLLLAYGGLNGTTYDGTVVTVQTPWMDDKKPKMTKLIEGYDAAIAGYWHIKAGADPTSGGLATVYDGVAPTGNEASDSTFDLLAVSLSQTGTHFLIQATTDPTWGQVATLSELQAHYNAGEKT